MSSNQEAPKYYSVHGVDVSPLKTPNEHNASDISDKDIARLMNFTTTVLPLPPSHADEPRSFAVFPAGKKDITIVIAQGEGQVQIYPNQDDDLNSHTTKNGQEAKGIANESLNTGIVVPKGHSFSITNVSRQPLVAIQYEPNTDRFQIKS